MTQGRTYPPLPADMLRPLMQIVKSPEKPVWFQRAMKFAEGKSTCTVDCLCRISSASKQGVLALPQLVTVRATQWATKVPGVKSIVARMLIGQCNACETLYWCTVGDWTPFLLFRFIMQNQAAAAGPKILVPHPHDVKGHGGRVR